MIGKGNLFSRRKTVQSGTYYCTYTAFEMWWHTRRNQISSFGETDESILIGAGRQFIRLLAAEVCTSAVVMLDTPCSGLVWRVLATDSIRQFPLHFPSLRHRVPSHFNWSPPNYKPEYSNIQGVVKLKPSEYPPRRLGDSKAFNHWNPNFPCEFQQSGPN